jgi:hypothetical protein
MSKTITTNVRNDDAFGLLHLFEFDMYTLAGVFDSTLYFTDHDIFVYDGTNEYTPIPITFDKLNEDFSMQSDSINVVIDNINGALTTTALAKEWRNNRCQIVRVMFTPPAQTVGSDTYEFGVADNGTTTYPRLEISGLTKDTYTLFEGVIDTFSASSQTLNGVLTTQFTHWSKPYPARTYNQNEFTTIVDAINDVVYWGRQS